MIIHLYLCQLVLQMPTIFIFYLRGHPWWGSKYYSWEGRWHKPLLPWLWDSRGVLPDPQQLSLFVPLGRIPPLDLGKGSRCISGRASLPGQWQLCCRDVPWPCWCESYQFRTSWSVKTYLGGARKFYINLGWGTLCQLGGQGAYREGSNGVAHTWFTNKPPCLWEPHKAARSA